MQASRILCGLTLLSAAACASAGRTAAWEKTSATPTTAAVATSSSAAAALIADADQAWGKRDDQAQLEQAIAKWEKIIATDPSNAEVLIKLARAHYFLADGFLALQQEKQAEEFAAYQKGVEYGEKALLKLEPEFEKAMRAGGEFEKAIVKIGKPGLPAAYWYCTNLGRFASKQGLSERLYYKDKLSTAMKRIRELDPAYFYGAADRYLGAFYSILPSFAGRDLEKSAQHFTSALSTSPEYLGTKIVKAQFLAVQQDDEDLYRKLLDEVLKSEDGSNPDIAPENRAAKRTAEKMLKDAEEIF